MQARHDWVFIKTLWGVLLIVILGAAPAWAVLGEPEASVSADGQLLRGQIRDEVHEAYRLHEITDPSGSVVREYVSPAGKVFGISWRGPSVPNMRQLLGSYFTYLQQHARPRRRATAAH